MGFFDRLFGRERAVSQPRAYARPPQRDTRTMSEDERAVERYRYMLKTAPPETVEQAHEEAFAKLSPEQRALVLQELTAVTPESERAGIDPRRDDPRTLSRLATRAEMRQPGTMEQMFNRPNQGGMMGGGMMGGGMGLGTTIFTSLAAGFVGSMVAQSFMDSFGDPLAGADFGGEGTEQVDDTGDASDTGDTGGDFGGGGGDFGGGDFGGGDFGGDFGEI